MSRSMNAILALLPRALCQATPLRPSFARARHASPRGRSCPIPVCDGGAGIRNGRSLQETMEAAWEEAKGVAAGSREIQAGDPDFEALWQAEGDGEPQTLEGVWSRTAARLEAGEGLDGPGTKEVPYELNANNPFSELGDPFAQGMKLFEEGKISDAALCFEAEIARNPENSQVSPWDLCQGLVSCIVGAIFGRGR